MKAYVKAINCALPKNIEENPKNRLTKKIGIFSRHICQNDEIASDLAIDAAQKLFRQGIDINKIDMLLYCTQSPDYLLPTTACIIQDRLGLPQSCGALDYNLGCSGYIYGLSLAKGLIESGQVENVLLITAETYSKYINSEDNRVKPLFGDAATATYIEGLSTDKPGLDGFVFGTNGGGYKNLIVPVGGGVFPYARTAMETEKDEYANIRTNYDLHMNGAAISEFALDVVPETVKKILKKTNKERKDIGYYIFHQANRFMLEYLQMKCELLGYPFWNDVKEYGNTVSSSIPLAIRDMYQVTNLENPIIMSIGFGVGLSWGGCLIDMSQMNKEERNSHVK